MHQRAKCADGKRTSDQLAEAASNTGLRDVEAVGPVVDRLVAVPIHGVAAVAVEARVVLAELALLLAVEDLEPRSGRVSIRNVTERKRETDLRDTLLKLLLIRGGICGTGLRLHGLGSKPDSI